VLDDKGFVVIIAFGLPGSCNNDDSFRAVRCAFLIESFMRTSSSVNSRIGISQGDVYCGIIGSLNDRCEYGLMGSSVNLAARLMCIENFGIRVDENIYRTVCGYFDFIPEFTCIQVKGSEQVWPALTIYYSSIKTSILKF